MKGRHPPDCIIYLQRCQVSDHLERREGLGGCAGILMERLFLAESQLAHSVRSVCVCVCVGQC